MKKKFFQKNVIRDLYEREYAGFSVIMIALLFLEVVQFYIVKSTVSPNQDYTVGLFSHTFAGRWFAVFGPFLIVWRLLRQYNSAEGRELFYSLPTTRRSVFGSVTAVAFGALAAFLVTETLLTGMAFSFSKYVRVEKGYYLSKIALTIALFLFFYGAAMICFSLSSGLVWYGVLSAVWLGLGLLLYDRQEELLNFHLRNHPAVKVKTYLEGGGKLPFSVLFRSVNHRITERGQFLSVLVDFDESGKALAEFWRVLPVMLAVGLLAGILGYFAFVKRKAERTDGKCKSRLMHVALQAAVTELFLVSFGWTLIDSVAWESYGNSPEYMTTEYKIEADPFPYALKRDLVILLVILPGLLIWEGLFHKSVKKVWKIWEGLAIVVLLEAVIFWYVYI